MVPIRAAAEDLGISVVGAKSLVRHFEVPPPPRLLPVARRLGGFKPIRDGFKFGNSWTMSEADSRAIARHYHRRVESSAASLLALAVEPITELPGVKETHVTTALDALRAPLDAAVGSLLQIGSGDRFAMCGGMAFAGLDFFQGAWDVRGFGGVPPATGDPLRAFILQRHLDSLDANLDVYVDWHLTLHLLPRLAEAVAIRVLCLLFRVPLPPAFDAMLLTPVQTMGVRDLFEPIVGFFGKCRDAARRVGEWADGLQGQLREELKDAASDLKDALNTAGDAIADFSSEAFHKVLSTLRSLVMRFLDFAGASLGGPQELLRRSRVEWLRIRQHLERAEPWPVGLVHDSLQIWKHHQVVAIAARDLPDGRHELDVWDNAIANLVVTWTLDLREETLRATRSISPVPRLVGFFVEYYEPELPPVTLR